MGEYTSLIVYGIIVALIVINWKKPSFKKYRKYVYILAPKILTLIQSIFMSKDKDKRSKELENKITDIKGDIKEAQMEADIEIKAARAKNKEVIDKLKEVKKVPDKVERRKKLSELIG